MHLASTGCHCALRGSHIIEEPCLSVVLPTHLFYCFITFVSTYGSVLIIFKLEKYCKYFKNVLEKEYFETLGFLFRQHF